MKDINDVISFLPCSENPLSADVYVIKGAEYSYIVDVGSCDEAYNIVSSFDRKKIIITHFHDDHMKNLARIRVRDEDLYIGDHTRKVLEAPVYRELEDKKGTVVTEMVEIQDGVNIKIYPVPNSHAKGSLLVTVNDEYLILGDSYYCSAKGYNVSLLHDEIRLLKEISFDRVIMSHSEEIRGRDEVIAELESYYDRREKNSPYIKVF
ncbi:MBL fold metallo-hydrolase [Butyrivibrio proteoclasticus]|uniref:MBL fold metallo-hydrolase n=1 Tax=Butyrivibrio proteoclasticus TaxID=43305 RepID=UPI00047DB6E8|nr:MBL fold metallo-hydrolase [Butyrivibrio proteoclasticus]